MLSHAKTLTKEAVIRWLLWRDNVRRKNSPTRFAGLPPELWGWAVNSDGRLTIDGIDVQQLVAGYGTPLHVLNKQCLLDRYNDFLQSFRGEYPNTVLATSYKTNPVPGALRILHEAGSHAEVISHFELWLALNLGVPPGRIILNGPGKTDAALELAVEKRVGIINIDNLGEIEKVATIARQRGVRQKVGLRVTTSVGWSSQFGLSIASGNALDAFQMIRGFPELLPRGLHLHLGTGIQNVATYVQAVRELLDFADALGAQHDVLIDHYDLGGGFGVPTVRTMSNWDLRMISLGHAARPALPDDAPKPAHYARALGPLLQGLTTRQRNADTPSSGPVVVFEPGRAITSASQVLLLSVLARKTYANGREFVIVDGGKNITMPLGWETHRIFAANRMDDRARGAYDVFGPLCHPGDVVARNLSMPALEQGDVLAIMDAGAYFIPNQMNFSNPRPPIVMVDAGTHSVLRRRESFHDVVRLDAVAEDWNASAG